MKLFMLGAPHLIQDADQDQGQSAPNKRICSRRMWRTAGKSFSTFGSRSKYWCRRRKIKTPTDKQTRNAMLKATRSARTPACSITATKAIMESLVTRLISIFETESEASHVFPLRLG